MNTIGFILVVLSGTCLGLSAAGEIRRELRQTEEAIRLADRLRFFVCVRYLSLPEAMMRLDGEFPFIAQSVQGIEDRIREDGFDTMWRTAVHKSGLSRIPSGILVMMGEELSGGESPDRVFSACLSELHEHKDFCLSRMRESAKLYPVIGLSVGCLMGIMLL